MQQGAESTADHTDYKIWYDFILAQKISHQQKQNIVSLWNINYSYFLGDLLDNFIINIYTVQQSITNVYEDAFSVFYDTITVINYTEKFIIHTSTPGRKYKQYCPAIL